MTESMTDTMKPGCYIVEDTTQLNGTIIYIESIDNPIAGNSIKSRRYVKGTVELSEKYKNTFRNAPYKAKNGSLGNNAFVYDSTDKKHILLIDGENALINAKIVPCPIKEGGRRRKTFRNKRKLRLRKTKSANKRR